MSYRHSIQDVMDHAAKIAGLEGWQAYSWQAADGGSIVTGVVPSGTYSRGPRKGRPKFRPGTPGTERTVVVSNTDLNASAQSYERDEGKCYQCKGTGQNVARVSVTDGTSYRPCSRCDGTGLPATPQPSTAT